MKAGSYILLLVCLLFSLHDDAWALPTRSPAKKLNLPSRPKNAMSGSQFLVHIRKLNGAQRERAMVQEVLRGNVPSFERTLVPIEKRVTNGPYKGQVLRYWVLSDYLAIGSDHDFIRVPINLQSIKVLSAKLNLSLPTTKMVDEIYAHAPIKLRPKPLPLNREITSTQNIARHETIVRKQLSQVSARPGVLVAGHKKDVVQSRRLVRKPKAIAIYGWHRNLKKPIQPLSTVHSAEYADYSHGVRLVANTVEIGNKAVDLRQALREKHLAGLLSYESAAPQATPPKNRKGYPVAAR